MEKRKRVQLFRHGWPIVLCSLLILVSCKKEESDKTAPQPILYSGGKEPALPVEEKNRSLLIKFSGTLCEPCGEWGWEMLEEIIRQKKEKTCFLSGYSQNFVAEGLISSTATAMDRQWMINTIYGYPGFLLNGVVTQKLSTDAEKEAIKNGTDAFVQKPVQASVAFKRKILSGRRMEVQSSVKFFQFGSGAYYLALYLSEDSVQYKQSGHPQSNGIDPVPHHYVLRTQVNGDPWYGALLYSGNVAPGAFIDGRVEYEVPADWNLSHLSVTAVIWRMNGNVPEFINSSTDQL